MDLMKQRVLTSLVLLVGKAGVITLINPAVIKDMLLSFVLHKKVLMSHLSVRKIIFHYRCCQDPGK